MYHCSYMDYTECSDSGKDCVTQIYIERRYTGIVLLIQFFCEAKLLKIVHFLKNVTSDIFLNYFTYLEYCIRYSEIIFFL